MIVTRRQKERLEREEECERILACYGADLASFDRISVALDRQFVMLHNRAHVLFFLCGIVITSTTIVAHFTTEMREGIQLLLMIGGGLALISAVFVLAGVLKIRWMTQHVGEDLRGWLRATIEFRDRKTRAYVIASALLVGSLACYQLSMGLAIYALAT
jgi:hypothetical protein